MHERAVALILVEQNAIAHEMREHKAAAAGEIGVRYLDIRILLRNVVLARKQAAHITIARLVVDGLDAHRMILRLVADVEDAEVANDLRAQELMDEAFVAEIRPGILQSLHGLTVAREVREPPTILIRRLQTDALDVAHHRKAERVRVEAREAAIGEARLIDNGRVHVHELEHGAVRDEPLLVETVHDLVVHERRAAFVHHFGLALRIEIGRKHAHDAQNLTLPARQLG